ARGLPRQRMAAVTAHDIVGAQRLPRAVRAFDAHRDAGGVLAQIADHATVHCLHRRQLRDTGAQHRLGRVLRQALVGGEIIVAHQLTLEPVIAIIAEQLAVGGEAADTVFRRNGPRASQRVLGVPEIEMLHRPLGQVLTLGNGLRLDAALDDDAIDAELAERNREAQTDGTTADNGYLRVHVDRGADLSDTRL